MQQTYGSALTMKYGIRLCILDIKYSIKVSQHSLDTQSFSHILGSKLCYNYEDWILLEKRKIEKVTANFGYLPQP